MRFYNLCWKFLSFHVILFFCSAAISSKSVFVEILFPTNNLNDIPVLQHVVLSDRQLLLYVDCPYEVLAEICVQLERKIKGCRPWRHEEAVRQYPSMAV